MAGVRPAKVSRILKENEIRIRTSKDVDFLKYKLNDNYFNSINSRNKAYWLGYLFADGCVSNRSNQISIVSNDEYLLNSFKEEIKCTKEIYQNPNHKRAKTLYFSSSIMKKDLINLGCTPRKSLTIEFPNVNNEYYGDFLRGNFDGDGCITKSNTQTQAYFLGTKKFLNSIQDILNQEKIQTNKIQKNMSIFRLRITGKKNLRLLKGYLYNNDPKFFLQRKKGGFDFA